MNKADAARDAAQKNRTDLLYGQLLRSMQDDERREVKAAADFIRNALLAHSNGDDYATVVNLSHAATHMARL